MDNNIMPNCINSCCCSDCNLADSCPCFNNSGMCANIKGCFGSCNNNNDNCCCNNCSMKGNCPCFSNSGACANKNNCCGCCNCCKSNVNLEEKMTDAEWFANHKK